jgi:hypothetical protein
VPLGSIQGSNHKRHPLKELPKGTVLFKSKRYYPPSPTTDFSCLFRNVPIPS